MRLRLSGTFAMLLAILCLSSPAKSSGLGELSSCASKCNDIAISKSTCASLQDPACLCGDATFRPIVLQCLTTTCTPKESLRGVNATATMCGDPVRNRSHTLRKVNISLFVLTMCVVIARTASHMAYGRSNILSDVNMCLIVVLDIAVFVMSHKLLDTGLGRDLWTLPFSDIYTTLKYFWICEILFAVVGWLIRIAFVLFFLQIFTDRKFQIIIWVIIAGYLCIMVTTIGLVISICTPVSYFWTSWDAEHAGRCRNHNVLVLASSSIFIAADLLTFALPLSRVWGLHMSLKKKIGVAFMLSVGLFVTIVAIIRITTLVRFATTPNISWDYVDSAMWALVELQVGIICLCMPSLRLGLSRLFPSIMGSSRGQGSTADRSNGRVIDRSANRGKAFTNSRGSRAAFGPQGEDDASFVQLVENPSKTSVE
ncbi:hypothetical protein FB567DRAFT_616205 [Paraphoma chrysanthemicola]|uniref:Extracellular membrane protein CFEM domain-containing protein n=1 Tax=Paraphoma chrysanthemicola TaxID=798071 RepID=A0A8K0QT27_9PLEO|nr:hypothetical protein FB567DRAFT_616205 [Paraphoma chrysanthemicola]